ncbi:hypothetical protein NDN08_003520 [Rhodosorus marinus]|uniref:Reverse transcriptase Ty1/copia-type domain-containing protein n=1 Tax=Rhodosorus marinus TaxID=101924 RepID=A0AAV8V0F7_9RHOD|nr:hypothetical protein NDN08_003520 [Rhodosorus marinus]
MQPKDLSSSDRKSANSIPVRWSRAKKKQEDNQEASLAHIYQSEVLNAEAVYPGTYQAATNGVDGEVWRAAVNEEVKVLERSGTWQFSELPDGRRPLATKGGISVYVDDLLVAAPVIKDIDRVMGLIKAQFPVKELGEVRDLLGVRLWYDRERGVLKLSQPGLAQQIYNGAGVGRYVSTPLDAGNLAGADEGKEIQQVDQYRALVGKALYLATMTRPDLSFAKLKYGKVSTPEVVTYSDASFGNERGRTSVTGYATLYGGNLINWGSKKQSVVSQSTCEAELIAANEGGRDAIWAYNLLNDLGEVTQTPRIGMDNSGALALVKTE